MSYRVGTPNYNLPQTEGTDKRDWFDTNEAFRNVDADLHAVVEQSSSQSAVIEALQTDIGNLQTGLEDTNTEVSGIKTKQATDEENIAQNAQAISQLNTKVESLDTDLAEMIEVTEEESATASVQHNVGDYFRYNDNLWITTVLIRVGDEIVPNVNCETTDVMTRVYNLEHSGGGSVSADAVSFDNTGTDLVSTNVENVVKELNNKIPTIPTLIDDTTVSSQKTWSSFKIGDQLDTKADKEGSIRFNTTSGKPEYFDGTQWVELALGGSGMKCVKFGTFDSQGATSISVSDLGFTDANDYAVILNGDGAGGNPYISAKSATAFTITPGNNASYHQTGSYQVLSDK